MRRRVWGGLGKVWLLAIAMIMALGTVGVTYSGWLDVVSVNGAVNTGTMATRVECGLASSHIYCYADPSTPQTLKITVNGATPGSYYCDFNFINGGSLPVKINYIAILPIQGSTPPPADAIISVANIAAGSVIDPGTRAGAVNINIGSTGNFVFTVTLYYGPFNG
jgi:hypothetical protein